MNPGDPATLLSADWATDAHVLMRRSSLSHGAHGADMESILSALVFVHFSPQSTCGTI
jgi:hypothetical protein